MVALVAILALPHNQALAQGTAVQEPTGTDPVAASAAPGAQQEIVVTAQRRAERQVDVPITVTTLGSEQLATANVRELIDIAKVTPALRFDGTGAFTQPTIRGVGTAITTSGGGANVGLYLDGFYSPNPLASNAQLLNVESVQVLKGPQGTLFGRNTTGGAILIQTAEPSEETAAQVKASYGRFNTAQAQAYATTGLAPGLAVDIEGLYRRGDGSLTNIANGNDEVGKFENWSVRGGLRMQFSDDVSLLLRYQHVDVDDPATVNINTYVDPVLGPGAANLAPPGSFTTDPDEVAKDLDGYFRSLSNIVQATLRWDLGFADLTSYTQYRTEDSELQEELDFIATPTVGFILGLPVYNETWSQEILLTSKPGTPLQWTGGLFYFSNRDTYTVYFDNFGAFRDPNGFNRTGGSSTTTKSYAAFADLTYEINRKLFVTAGARYSHDVVTDAYYNLGAAEVPVPSIKGDRVTPRFVVRYKPTDQSSVYASFTRGYKARIIDVGGTCQNPPAFQCNDIRPEVIDAYEVGAKFDDRRLSVEASAFFYDYKNLQISTFLGTGQAAISNAARAEVYGLEGALRYRFGDRFDVNAGAAWTHGRYKRFDDAPIYVRCPGLGCTGGASAPFETSFVVPSGTTLRNVTMQRTPEFTGNVGARYRADLADGELELSGNLYYSSKVFFGPSGIQFPQNGYEQLTARAQWTDPTDRFMVALWGDNLTNKRYRTSVQYNSFGIGANWNAPVTYGVEVGAKF